MIWESMERELGFSEGCGMGEWGRQKRLLQRKSSLFVCLPYSAHAIGFRLSLPLLTFSTPDLRDSPHIHTSSAAVLSDSYGNIIAAVSKKHALVDVNAGEAHVGTPAVGHFHHPSRTFSRYYLGHQQC